MTALTFKKAETKHFKQKLSIYVNYLTKMLFYVYFKPMF